MKNQTSYVKRVSVLGKSFAFNPENGLSLPDGPYWDKIIDALLALPGIELVSGDQPQSAPAEIKAEPIKPEPQQPQNNSLGVNTVKKTTPGVQPAAVKVDEPKVEAQPEEAVKEKEEKPEESLETSLEKSQGEN